MHPKYAPLIDSRYKLSAAMVSLKDDWSGMASDLYRDRSVWVRILSTIKEDQALNVWRQNTELTRQLGRSFILPSLPKRTSCGASLYQVADLPQQRWSNLTYLAQRSSIGWDGAVFLVEQLAEQLTNVEAAGLQPQGNLASQILIDGNGNIMICGHWEKAVRNDWAGPALLKILQQLIGSDNQDQPALTQLKAWQAVGRLGLATSISSALHVSDISPPARARAEAQSDWRQPTREETKRARQEIKSWLEDSRL